MDEACGWLAQQGVDAARTGMGMLDFPYVIDAYEALPPSLLRQNPAYYHVLIKHAGFEAEKGFVDYKIQVRPQLIERWQKALDGAQRAGFTIVPVKDIPAEQRARVFAEVWNETFTAHWGWTPWVEAEVALLFEAFAGSGILDTSVFAYAGEDPIGMLLVTADEPSHATLAPGRVLDDAEKLNILAIGVRQRARGRGVNYAMAAYAFLELVRRGQTHLSYTLVLDDNWPSRRTGEGLGASLCANYLAYRRNFRR
jgi:GNAT superfamily N-acetyltransferase